MIIVIGLHLAYEYFIVRKNWEEEDYFSYEGIGLFILIGIWFYAENLIVDKWELTSKNFLFYAIVLPYTLISSTLIGGSWRHWQRIANYFRRKDKASDTI